MKPLILLYRVAVSAWEVFILLLKYKSVFASSLPKRVSRSIMVQKLKMIITTLKPLNIPGHHPARAMHDTFYFDATHLLRTHTSGANSNHGNQSAANSYRVSWSCYIVVTRIKPIRQCSIRSKVCTLLKIPALLS